MTDYPVRIRDYSQGSYGKRHISNSGKVAFCRAEVHACPRGRHFNSEEDAKFYIESHPQGEVKPVTELVPMKAATSRNADNLMFGKTKAGDIYEFTITAPENTPRLDRGALRNEMQEIGGGAHTVVAFENGHKARIQLTVPEDKAGFGMQDTVNQIAEVHGFYDGNSDDDSPLAFEVTGYKSINTGRKLLPKSLTAAEVLKAGEGESAVTGPDSSIPEGYFGITTKVMGYTRTYVLKGDPGDQEAPVIGRIDIIGEPGHARSNASAGSGLLGGEGLTSFPKSQGEWVQQMIRKQDEKEAKTLARA